MGMGWWYEHSNAAFVNLSGIIMGPSQSILDYTEPIIKLFKLAEPDVVNTYT
jgi:hypothetical protein